MNEIENKSIEHHVLEDIQHVYSNPNYKNNGFTVIFNNNGSITLKATSVNDYHMISISKEDSDLLLRIIEISTKEKINTINKKKKNGIN